MKTLFALAFLLCISVGCGLKCYKCSTLKSWDACNNTAKEKTCGSSYDRCWKMHLVVKASGVTSASYEKGCTMKSYCNKDYCKALKKTSSVKITKCEIDCCSGDLCNGAQVPMVSAIILLACALVAFFR